VEETLRGVIIKSNAGLYDVYINETDTVVQTTSRGVLRHQDKQPIVGDYVILDTKNETAIIAEILPRKNELIRPLIANIDAALTVISVKEPSFQQYLLDKYIALLEFHQIKPIIVLTKLDLLQEEDKTAIAEIKKYYVSIGYSSFDVNGKALADKAGLTAELHGKITAIMGQTGVGKTTLLNDLSDNAWQLQTNEISRALGRGKHTTRIVELFRIDDYWIADTPGFSSFRLDEVRAKELTRSFIEFSTYPCQFSDCVHINEQRCGVKAAVADGTILPARYDSYRKLYEEIKTQEEHKKW